MLILSQKNLVIFLFLKFTKNLGVDLKIGLGMNRFENC